MKYQKDNSLSVGYSNLEVPKLVDCTEVKTFNLFLDRRVGTAIGSPDTATGATWRRADRQRS